MRLGDRIVCVVQRQRNFGAESSVSIANKVRRGDIRHAVIVRVRKERRRPDGSYLKFDDNACVLINKSGDPIGTRMNGQWFTLNSLFANPHYSVTDMKNRSRGFGITKQAVVQNPIVGAGSRVTYTNYKANLFYSEMQLNIHVQ